MDVPPLLLLALVVLAGAGWLVAWLAARRARTVSSRKRSLSTRYGKLTEQFAPWMRTWPFEDPRGFRFLGDPVDGVQFEEDAVYLVEVKAAGATLSPRQRAIRDAVLAGRVGWVTFAVDGKRAPEVARPWEKR